MQIDRHTDLIECSTWTTNIVGKVIDICKTKCILQHRLFDCGASAHLQENPAINFTER